MTREPQQKETKATPHLVGLLDLLGYSQLVDEFQHNPSVVQGVKYGPPKKVNDDMLYLNVPHFIDSTILEIEKLCGELTGSRADDVMARFIKYAAKRFP